MAYKPFKMKGHTLPGIRQKSHDTQSGKSPYQKELVGNQENLNEGLKRAIEATPAKQRLSSEHPDTYVYDGDNRQEKIIDLEDRIEFIREDMFNETGDSIQQKQDIATLQGKLKKLRATKPKNK